MRRSCSTANSEDAVEGYLERISQPVEIVASVDDSDKSREMLELLNDIESLSALVKVAHVRDATAAQLKPSFALRRPGAEAARALRRPADGP